MSERRYNNAEVALILQNAVAADDDDPAVGSGKDLSLPELKEIGAEVGIGDAQIEAAARALERHDVVPGGTVLGMPTSFQGERVVPVRVAEEHLPRLLDVIRQVLARQGTVEEVLGGLEWRARSNLGNCTVSIRPEGDQTRIRVLADLREGKIAGAISGGVGGAVVGAAFVATPLIALPAGLAGAALAMLGPVRILSRRQEGSLNRLLDALEREALASVPSEDS